MQRSEKVRFEDGAEVCIRPIRPEDAPRLRALHSRLSPQTIYLRFLQQLRELPEKQAIAFAEVDGKSRMALVASRGTGDDCEVVAVARYALLEPEAEGKADVAIVVEDRYQGRGLGTTLLTRLVDYARAHGVRAFVATVFPMNDRMMGMIKRSGLPTQQVHREPGVVEIQIDLQTDENLGEGR